MIVRSIKLLIELNHQTFEERGELLLLLTRLKKPQKETKKERDREHKDCEKPAQHVSLSVSLLCSVSPQLHCLALTTSGVRNQTVE